MATGDKIRLILITAILAVVLTVIFTACSTDPAGESPPTGTTTLEYSCAQVVVPSNDADAMNIAGNVGCINIDGYNCYIWKQRVGSGTASNGYGGLTCDFGEK